MTRFGRVEDALTVGAEAGHALVVVRAVRTFGKETLGSGLVSAHRTLAHLTRSRCTLCATTARITFLEETLLSRLGGVEDALTVRTHAGHTLVVVGAVGTFGEETLCP